MAISLLENQVLQLFLISFAAVLIQNLLFKKLSDQAALREMKKQLDSAQIRMKKAQKEQNAKAMEIELKKIQEFSTKRLSMTMKPNLISSLAFILVIGWIQTTYAKLIVNLPIPLPIWQWKLPPIAFSSTLGWFGWYFYVAILSSFVVKELLGIET
ncbi:MAG: EMC3/TMCO1 family protein [archaeon]